MASETDTYVFEIRSGLYRGVTHNLDQGRHVVGSGDGSDLVLMEPDLAPQHAAVVLQGATVRIEGFAEGISVAGAGPVPAGAARTVRLPARIDIAGIETVWHDRIGTGAVAQAPTSTLSRMRRFLGRPAVPGIAAAGILAVTIFLTVANPIAGAAVLLDGSAKSALERIGVSSPAQDQQHSQTSAAAASAPAVMTVSPAPSLPPPAPSAPAPATMMPVAAPTQPAAQPAPQPAAKADPKKGDPKSALAQRQSKGAIDTATAALKRQVEQAGLLNVQVSAGGGAVAATGFIEPSMAGRWESLQKEFDERFVGEVTLFNSVVVKAEKLPASLGIEGVWRGSQPYIVIRGQRYLVGAVVDGGWAIRGIERDRVMLEREGRLVAMRF